RLPPTLPISPTPTSLGACAKRPERWELGRWGVSEANGQKMAGRGNAARSAEKEWAPAARQSRSRAEAEQSRAVAANGAAELGTAVRREHFSYSRDDGRAACAAARRAIGTR